MDILNRNPPKASPSDYMKAVIARGLILPTDQELNCQEKGSTLSREKLPLISMGRIGLTAFVDKVQCRRITLAMSCGRRFSVEDTLAEVVHLQNLRHPHSIQLVGSYLQGKKFAVLLYPVADTELGHSWKMFWPRA